MFEEYGNPMSQLCKLIIILITLSATPVMSQAQTPPTPISDAGAIVDSANAALTAQNWTGFTSYMHPLALEEFKFYVVRVTELRIEAGKDDERFAVLFGRPTVAEVQNADPAVLFTNFLRTAIVAAPEFGKVLMHTEIELLGVVEEGDYLRHVLIRRTYDFGGTLVRRMEVISLGAVETTFRLFLPPTIETFLDELGWPQKG